MRKKAPPKREGRPHRIPPAPRPPDVVSAARSLDEVAATGGNLWVVLWQALGDLWLWSSIPPEQRSELFGPSTRAATERVLRSYREAPELMEALETFALLRRAGEMADGSQLAAACIQVYRWAEAGSMIELAAYFAEVAAVADPEDPTRANEAARLCRRAGLPHRAVAWYERSFQLAVRAQNRRESVWALLGYGSLLYGMGCYDRARPIFEKVAKRAHRTSRRRTAAEAHHDLTLLCLDMGDLPQAEEHARLAENLYPRQANRIPYFVHDCAVLLVRYLYHSPALSLLRKLPLYFSQPEEMALVWSTLSRAAAGAAQREHYLEAERKTLELVGLYEEHAAAALVNLAHGARFLREHARAKRYAELAAEIATRRKEHGEVRRAREVLRQIEREEPVPEEAPAPEEITAFVRRLAARLRMWNRRPRPLAGEGFSAG